MPDYFSTPEETAECGYCGYRNNGCEWKKTLVSGEWNECPGCGYVDDSVPYLDEEDIAREAAEAKEPT